MKRMLFAGAAVVVGVALVPSAAQADGYVITQCDESTCYVYECSSYPNINGTGWDMTGCSMIYMYPRPREVSGN